MADLGASDITITLQRSQIMRGSPGGVRRNVVKLVFGDGAKQYRVSTHLPVPSFASFGLIKRLDELQILQNSLTTVKYIWEWDYANQKLIGFEEVAAASSTALAEIADTTAIAAQTLYAAAWGW